jgi:hypothetical protein
MLIQLQKKHSGSQKNIWSHINPFSTLFQMLLFLVKPGRQAESREWQGGLTSRLVGITALLRHFLADAIVMRPLSPFYRGRFMMVHLFVKDDI